MQSLEEADASLKPLFSFPSRLVVSSLEALESCLAVGPVNEKASLFAWRGFLFLRGRSSGRQILQPSRDLILQRRGGRSDSSVVSALRAEADLEVGLRFGLALS